jgi:hypothetical protein
MVDFITSWALESSADVLFPDTSLVSNAIPIRRRPHNKVIHNQSVFYDWIFITY